MGGMSNVGDNAGASGQIKYRPPHATGTTLGVLREKEEIGESPEATIAKIKKDPDYRKLSPEAKRILLALIQHAPRELAKTNRYSFIRPTYTLTYGFEINPDTKEQRIWIEAKDQNESNPFSRTNPSEDNYFMSAIARHAGLDVSRIRFNNPNGWSFLHAWSEPGALANTTPQDQSHPSRCYFTFEGK